MAKTREETRNIRANKLASELRFQLANYGEIVNNGRIYDFLLPWVSVAKKEQMKRPK